MSDDEMREWIVDRIWGNFAIGRDECVACAADILAELRRRGAWLPGSVVSDEMVDAAVAAYERCLKTHNLSGPEAEWSSMRAAITTALNAIPRSGT